MKIVIETYNPKWIDDFAAQHAILSKTLAGFDAVIEHIGSTSVPGLGAKPIIDILIGLRSDTDLGKVAAPMMEQGYTYFRKYEPAMPYRRFFVQLEPLPGRTTPAMIDIGEEFITGQEFIAKVNIHIVVKDTPHWDRHIAFRDYLRAHPDVSAAYDTLKREISLREFKDTLEYNDAKDAFVKRVEQEALVWYKESRS